MSWRERETAWCAPSAVGTHDLGYAYSEDAGRTWLNNDGEQIATTTLGPTTANITPWSPGVVVVEIPINSGLINQETQNVDSAGRLHVVTSRVPDQDIPEDGCVRSLYDDRRASAVPYHHWRDTDGTWRTLQLPTKNNSSGRSKLVFSSDDTAYVVLPDARIIAATAETGWTDWTVIFDDPAVDNVSETVIDSSRVATENVLSVGYQEATTGAPSAYRITDFSLGSTAPDAPRDTTPAASPLPVPGTQNLALNPSGEGFPAAFASSSQPAQPARLVNDGDPGTFWVSSGLLAGQGPTPARPEFVGVDLGKLTTFTTVDMVPRPRPAANALGPSSYTVETSVDGVTWRQVAAVTNAPRSTTVQSDFAPVTARLVRLLVTGSYPVGGANVQVSELVVRDRSVPNRAPTVQDLALATDEDMTLAGQVLASDPDPADVLTYAFGAPQTGSVVGDPADGSFTYQPAAGFVGTDSFTVTVDDVDGKSDQAVVTVVVADDLARNTTGEGFPLAFASSTQGGPYAPSAANDGDPGTFWVSGGLRPGDGPTSEAPEFVGVDLSGVTRFTQVAMTPRVRPDGGGPTGPIDYTVEVSDDGQTWTRVGEVVGAPANRTITTSFPAVRAERVRLLVTASSAGSAGGLAPNTQVASLEVRDLTQNSAPTVGDLDVTTVQGTPVTGQVVGADADLDQLTYVYGEPSSGTVVGDPVDASFTYTPVSDFVGHDTFEVSVTDPRGATASAVVTITVTKLVPATKDDCKDGGWQRYSNFPNQGQCVAWVNTEARGG